MGYRLMLPEVLHRIGRQVLIVGLSFGLCMGPCLLSCPQQAKAALFGSFGIKDEQELGRKFSVLVRSRLPLIEDPEIKLYVQSIVNRLSTAIPPQPFPFEANVLLASSMNAFAVPGGNVFVHTGLIMQLEHESELAGVLAHELAHVTQRHVAQNIERSQMITLGSLIGALAGIFLGGSGSGALASGSLAAGQAAILNYSRENEAEADQTGLLYIVKSGFRPQGMAGAFQKISRRQWATGIDIPEYLSTHPDVVTRISEVMARVQALPVSVRNRPERDVEFLRVKALVFARHGDERLAARYFDQAKGQDAIVQMGRGILAERRNRMPEADRAFAQALELAPKDALIWREAGRFYYTIGDRRASSALLKALDLDPADTMAQFFYARTLDATGDKRTAQKYYAQVLRTVPEDIEVHYVYGRSLGESGQLFPAYLHLTYSATYENNPRKVKVWLKKTQILAKTAAEKAELKKLEKVISERKAYWGSGKDVL